MKYIDTILLKYITMIIVILPGLYLSSFNRVCMLTSLQTHEGYMMDLHYCYFTYHLTRLIQLNYTVIQRGGNR